MKSLIGVGNALAERGHRVRFLVPDYAAAPPGALHPAVQVRVLRSGSTWVPGTARKLMYLVRLATTATAGADVCLANYFTTAYAAWLSRTVRKDRAALAYNVRGYEPLSHGLLAHANLPSRLARFSLAWLSYRLPLRKIVTTNWLRDQTGDQHAYVVGHGIDPGVFRPPRERRRHPALTIGTIGRLGDAKGYPDFLRAVELLPAGLPIRVRIAAPDPVTPLTRFPVVVEQPTTELAMAGFYAECDLFVFSSRAEGFGLPALEAMASGCALVTTDCGGVRAFARPNENCLMVPPNDPRALAAAIGRLVGDEQLRAGLIYAGIATAQQFSREAVLERFCDYVEALSDTVRPSGGRDPRSG